jgi:hypothetical protein
MRATTQLVCVAISLVIACASETDSSSGDPVPAEQPFAELVDQGMADYLGVARVTERVPRGDEVVVRFDPETGPKCLRGGQYNVTYRDKPDSDDLVIFLAGGGACWSGFCRAAQIAVEGVPNMEILADENPANPVRDWDVLFLPYCDGSFFAADATFDEDGDGQDDRFQLGLRNLSAALDVAREQFPRPRRIFLAGSSGGAYGTLFAAPLTRVTYPNVPLYVFNDSGIGIGKGDSDPGFVGGLMEEYDAYSFLPASCSDCIANGHLTRYIRWQLDQDPNMKIAGFSSYGDTILAITFLMLGTDVFGRYVQAETRWLMANHDRFKGFLVDGGVHTTLGGDARVVIGADIPGLDLGGLETTVLDDLDIATWIRQMLADDPAWTSHDERAGRP